MKFKRVARQLLVAAFLILGARSTHAASKPLLVHYMPWFVAKPFSDSWGFHWTMNHFNPEVLNASGQRQIASRYHPLIGPYDSADPAVLEYHVLLMKLAGIDCVIVDWYGMDNYFDYASNNERTLALLQFTRKAGLKFSLCYEDQTIQQEINGGFIKSSEAIAHAQQTMLYARTNYFGDPSFLKWNNQPVLLNFGPQYFKGNSQWQAIFSVLPQASQPAFFTEDNRLAVGKGAFDWPPMWLSQSPGANGVVSIMALENYLASFEANAAGWPSFISSAFPRFHDIYAEANVSPSRGLLDDRNGDTLKETLSRAMTNGSAMIQLATWNDFGEGTIVEPTQEFGYRDLGIIQDLRRQYLEKGFANHTNDLGLATRLFHLRQQHGTNPVISAELDRAFTNIISGDLSAAGQRLSRLETDRPVIYEVAAVDGQLQFLIGGSLSADGLQVQTSSNLAPEDWSSITTLPATTNETSFSAPIQAQAAFFRIQNAGP